MQAFSVLHTYSSQALGSTISFLSWLPQRGLGALCAGSEREQSCKTVLSHIHSGCSFSLLGCSDLLEDGSFHKHLMKEKEYIIRGMGGNVYKPKLTRGLVRLL